MKSPMKNYLLKSKAFQLFAFLLIVLFILILFFLFQQIWQKPRLNGVADLSSGWTYSAASESESWQNVNLHDYRYVPQNKAARLQRVIEEDIPDAYLLVSYYNQALKLSMDGQLLFDSNPLLGKMHTGNGFELVKLPENHRGKTLNAEISSPFKMYAYTPEPIFIGDAIALFEYMESASVLRLAAMILCMFSGVLFWVLPLYSEMRKDRFRISSLSFGSFLMLWGTSIGAEAPLFIRSFSPEMASNLWYAFFYLYPLPILLFLRERFTHSKKVVSALLLLQILTVVLTFSLHFLKILPLPAMLHLTNIVLIFTVIVVILLAVFEWVKNNPFVRFVAPSLIPLILSAVIHSFALEHNYVLKEGFRFFGLFLLVALIAIYHIRSVVAEQQKQAEQRQILLLKNDTLEKQLVGSREYQKQTSMLRHDMRHHINILRVLSSQKKTVEMDTYLRELSTGEEDEQSELYCENALLNAIATKASWDARQNQIHFVCAISAPKTLPFQETELSSLLMNMLENAFEACQKLNPSDRQTWLNIRKRENFLVIECKNSFDPTLLIMENGSYLSTKKDSESHGFGIIAMQQAVEKMGSILQITQEDSIFCVKTALRL